MTTISYALFQSTLVALALLLGVTLLFRMANVSVLFGLYARWSDFLRRRGLFSAPLEAEARKVDLLRILTGVIFLHRTSNTVYYVFIGNDGDVARIAGLVALLLGALFTIGLFTPIVALILLFGNVLVLDRIFGTYTLGSDVLSMLLLTFTFAPSGTRISVDSIVASGQSVLSKAVRGTYAFFGTPSVERLVLVKWTTLFSYSVLCLYSVTLHLHEHLWISGYVATILLTNSYISRYHELFQSLALSSELFVLLTRISMWGMLVWYFVLLPFTLLGGWFRKAVIAWSILFFLVSTFVLQLGWLPYYEFVLLALLFWDRKFIVWSDQARLDVLYDDRCNLCDRTVRFLSRVDAFHALRFRPLTRNADLVETLGLTTDEVLHDLYGYDGQSRRIYRGYDLYAEVSKRVVLLLLLAPVLYLGRIGGIGPQIYGVVAKRRIEWFGVCQFAPDYNKARESLSPIADRRIADSGMPRSLISAFVTIHTVLALVFVAYFPIFGLPPQAAWLQSLTWSYAVMPIDVFNRNDLTLGEHWFTVEALAADGSSELVPFTGTAGERLRWHHSDRVYFGNSLHWRRLRAGLKEVCYKDDDVRLLKEIVSWHKFGASTVPTQYRVTYYYQPLPSVWSTPGARFEPGAVSKVCTVLLDANGTPQGVAEGKPTAISN